MSFQILWCCAGRYGGGVDGAGMNLIMGMFTAMAALIVGSIWNQHRESANARSEYKRDLERATDKLSAEFRDSKQTEFNGLKQTVDKRHDELKQTVDKNHETTQRKLDKITDSLADARERLARIGGHLGYGQRPRPDDEPGQDTTNAA